MIGASEDVVIMALEDAVTDGMDIANLSLGGPALTGALDTGAACGEDPGVPCDTLSQAVENATSLGMLVVVAAGNDGALGIRFPTLGFGREPGIAPSAMAVARDDKFTFLAVRHRTVSLPWTCPIYNTGRPPSRRAVRRSGRRPSSPKSQPSATNLFLTAQNYDPNGDLYSPPRYMVSQGTSFSTPMVAGSAALVKQRNPGWQPWQIKSALVNTATQDVTETARSQRNGRGSRQAERRAMRCSQRYGESGRCVFRCGAVSARQRRRFKCRTTARVPSN